MMYRLTWTPQLYQKNPGDLSTPYTGKQETVLESNDIGAIQGEWERVCRENRTFGLKPMMAYGTIGKLRSDGCLYALHIIGCGLLRCGRVDA